MKDTQTWIAVLAVLLAPAVGAVADQVTLISGLPYSGEVMQRIARENRGVYRYVSLDE
jgi:hypothetical protein